MLKSAVFLALEKSINFLLSRDLDSEQRLQVLENNIIAIELSDISLTFYWLFEHHQVRLLTEWRGDVDAQISGSVQTIARMGLSKAKVAKNLTVRGNMHVVEAFKAVFAKLDIDWSAQIAPITGDAAAYKLGKTVKQTSNWLQQAANSFRANSKDYLEEEVKLLPSMLHLHDFTDEIRQLQRDVDRTAAKIRRLQTHIAPTQYGKVPS